MFLGEILGPLRRAFGLALMLSFGFSNLLPVVYVAHAATGVPHIITHQGRLMDASGNLLGGTGGTDYCFRFSIYSDATVGGSDTELWPASTPAVMTVNVKNGVYNVGIGDTAAGGDALDFDFESTDTAYLNIEVATKVGSTCASGDGAESFENLSPRQRIGSAGYAVNAETVGGYTPAQSATGSQIPALTSGDLVLGDATPAVTATGSNTLTLQNAGTGDVEFFSSANKITSAGALTLAGSATVSGLIVTAGGAGVDVGSAGLLNIGNTTATSIGICNSAACDTLTIGSNTDADTITIGDASNDTVTINGSTVAISTGDWNISTTGAVTGVSFDANGTGNSISNIDNADLTNSALTVNAGTGLTNGGSVSLGGSTTLNIASGNGAIVANADDITLTVAPSANGLSSTTSSGSGLETLSSGLALLQGCANDEILKWNETSDMWACAADSGTGGGGTETLDDAYGYGGSITVDASDVLFSLADSSNDYKLVIDNATAGAIATGLAFTTTGGGSLATAIDVSAANIGTALAIGSNDITVGGVTLSSGELAILDGGIDNVDLNNSSLTVSAGSGLTNGGSVSLGGSTSLNIASGNGGIVVNADDISLTVAPSADGLSSTTSSGSGLQVLSSGLALLQGCANNEILKWNEASDIWACSADSSSGGSGTLDDGYNNGGTVTVDAYDVVLNLNNAASDYKFLIDNTTTGNINTAFSIATSGSGSIFTTAIDLTDADIVTAINFGTNDIEIGGATLTAAEVAVLDGGVTYGELIDSGTLTATTVDINGGAIDGTAIGASSSSSGSFTTLASTGITTIGNNGATVAIDSSDWNIDATGAVTGVSFDANGSGNSISNIESADIVDNTIANGDLANSSVTVTAGSGLANGGSVSLGGSTTLDIGAGNGITVNANDVAVRPAASADGLSATTSNGSGLEALASGLALLQGCADNEILKWDEDTDVWSCAADNSTGAIALDDAYSNGGTITVDAYDILFNLADATNDYKLTIDNTTAGAIATGMVFTSTGGGALSTAIDVSAASIGTAIALGSNDVTVGGVTISAAEFANLDGVNAAVLDANDNAATATALAANPTDCGANAFATAIAANGNLTCASITDADVPNSITVDLATLASAVTNATLTTALTVNTGTVTLVGNAANTSVLTLGAGASSFSGTSSGTNTGDQTTITGNAGTATALAANPTDCGANTFAVTIAANGNLTCVSITDADVPNNITVDLATLASAVTNATLTTALTVNTGTVTLVGNAANTSVLTLGAGASSFSGTSSGTNTGDQTSVTGNAGTVTFADASGDTTTFLALGTSATGSLAPATDAGLSYNATTDALTTTTFIGALTGNVTGNVSGSSGSTTGNAATATALAANPADCGANTFATTIAANGNLTCASITDADVPNSITVDLATLASAVTNATFTTALTVNTGTVTLVGNAANTSVLTLGAGASSLSGSSSGTNTGDQTSVTGNAGTVTFADAGGDTTTFLALGTSATGSLAPATDAGLSYNATTDALTTTTFIGALSGNATTATALAANPADCGANTFATTIAASGALTCASITDADVPNNITIDLATLASAVTNATLTTALTVNTGTVTLVGNAANTSVLTLGAGASSFSGTSSGTNTGDQTSVTGNAGTVTFADAGGDTTTFLALGTSATGSLAPATDAGLSYNATTDTLSTTTFIGALTGNVTGNVSGSSGSTTGNAATATALAANPSDCGANTFATTIAANGNLTCASITDADVPNGITVDLATLASAVTNATLTTALTVNTGTVTLVGNAANTSVLTLGAGASSLSGASSGTNTGDQTSVTGNAGTVTFADAGGDATTFLALGTSATGSLAPATDAGLTYNSTTDALTTTTFIGALTGNVTGNVSGSSGSTTGNAATATALAANPSDCGANTFATTIAANGNLTCASIVDADVPNNITVDLATLASTVTNATLTTALTVNTGTVTLVGNAANTSVLTLGAGASSLSGASSGTNTGDQTSVTGNAGTVTFADAAGDTTTFLALGTSATGSLAPATDAGLSYNATTDALTTTTFIGALTGNASTATALAANPSDCGANTFATTIAANGSLTCASITDADVPNSITVDLATLASAVTNATLTTALTVNTGTVTLVGNAANTSVLTLGAGASSLSGSSSGTNTGDQTSVTGNAGTVTFADAGGDTTTFLALGTSATGSLAPATDAGLSYNATTDALTTTTFIGALTGNVTGNVSGSSGSTTGNAATATALAANPSDCGANTFATTIAANGNLTCASILDADVPNNITVDLATLASAVTNATLTTALTVNTGTVTLVGNAANTSVLTLGAGASSLSGSSSGTNTGDQTSVTGNAGTVTFADAGGDTTTFLALGTSATGSLAPATDAGLSYNATTDALTTTTFIGALSGNATTATALAANPSDCGANTFATTIAANGNLTCASITDADVPNNITIDLATLASAVTNATLTTALTVNTGTVTLVGNAANTSVLTLGAGASSLSGSSSGTNTGDQTSVTGNAGTVTFADAAGDTTTFLALGTSATGSLAPATDAGLSYNATTDALTTTTFIGALTGNASTATALAANPSDCGANTFATTIAANGNLTCASIADADVPNNITIDLATLASTVTFADAAADATTFLALGTSATGSLAPATDAGLTYNANTDTLTTTTFVGALTGNASTATALAANPSDCGANTFATTIAANGNLTCASITDADVPNNITVDLATLASAVTNATLTTALTVNTGTVTLVGNAANTSVLTLGAGASSLSGSSSGTNTGDQTSVTGNAGTVTFADAGGDATTFVALGTSATGSLAPATDAGLSYNATTNALTASTFIGALTGNADTVTTNANLTGIVTSVGNTTAITLTSATNGLTGTSSASGLAAYTGSLSLLQGCTDGEVLKWVESTDTWDCSSDATGGTSSLDDAYNNGATIVVDAYDVLFNLADATNDYKLTIDNTTAGAIATGMAFTSTGGGALSTAVDVSAAPIGTAIALGSNDVTVGGVTISAAEFANLDGVNAAVLDANDNASTATALAANPTDCGANAFATAIAANGNLTCASITDADVPNSITVDLATLASAVTNATFTTALTVNTGTVTLVGNAANTSVLTLGAGASSLSGSSSGTNTGDQTSVTGNAGTVTFADAGGDTTTFLALGTSATGSLAPATDAGLSYNATTDALTTATFIGALSGNATTATALAANPSDCGANTFATTIAANGNLTCASITDADVPNNITIDLATLASAVTNATLTTALTVNTGTVTLVGNAANTSVLTLGAGASSFSGTSSGTNTGDQTSVTGNAGTVTFADAGGDTTTFLALGTSATGSLAPATDAGLSYNATTDALTTTTFIGALTGNATTATALAANPADCGANTFATTIAASGALTCASIADADVPNNITIDLATLASTVTFADAAADTTTFVSLGTSATGSLAPATDAGLTYNANTDTLTTTTFVGALTGNVTGNVSGSSGSTTGNAATVTFADAGGDTTTSIALGTSATGSLAPATDAGLTYNATTDALTTTTFIGALTGNASTATALAANPADCGANTFATTIAASGALTCASIADADVPNDITIDLATLASAVTNATLTTALTVNTGTVTLVGNAANTSVLTLGAGASSLSGSSSGTNTGDQTSVTGNAGTVTFADAGGDTTTFVALGTSATGSLAPATDAGLSYNATTNALTASTFIGALTGNADTVTTNANLTGIVTSVGNTTAITLTSATDGLTGTSSASGLAAYTGTLSLLQGCANDEILKWVEATDTWDCAADGGSGGTPTAITVANEAADTTSFIAFFTAATGDLGPKTNAGLTFDASTGVLSATGFAGPLTGNVTGNVSGSSGSTTGNAATATALAANPADCGANTFATTIAASGTLTCASIADADVPNSITVDLATLASTVTNATLTTALTVNTGTVTLVGNAANTSVLTLGAGASSLSGASSGTNTGDQTSVTGNAGTVTFADAAGDTTTFLALGTSATGSLAPATDAGLSYNATTDALTTTTFIGALSGNATTATALAANPADCGANTFATTIAASGALTCASITDADVPNSITVDLATLASTVTNATLTTALTVNTGTVTLVGNAANTSALTLGAGASSFSGTSSGTNTGDQTSVTGNAGTVTFADAGGDTTTFVALGTSATGSLAPATDAGLSYNATTNALTASTFIGALTGNASTVTTNANLSGIVTSVGNTTAITLTAATNGLTGTSSGSGLADYSGSLSLLQGCSDGQVLKWIEATDTWDCSAMSGGGLSDGDYGDITVGGTGTTMALDYTSADGAGGTSTAGGLEEGTGGVGLLQGCSDGQILKWNDGSAVWACGADADSGGSTAWSAIGDASGNGAIAFGSTTQTLDWGVMDANASFLTYNFTNAGTSAGTDSGVVINNAVTGANTDTTTENLMLIQQLDTTAAGTTVVNNALLIDSAANSGMVDGIEITNSGGNITGSGLNIVDTAGGTYATGITLSGTFTTGIDMGNSILANVGNAGTDFDASGGLALASNLTTAAGVDVRMTESGGGTDYVGFQAPAAVTSNLTWTLPGADAVGCFASDGAGTMSITACGNVNYSTYTSNTTYTKPSNTKSIIVEAIGGGGSGGGGQAAAVAALRFGGSGGGGGAYVTKTFDGADFTASAVNVTAPGPVAGGASATNGALGGNACLSTTAACGGTTFVKAFGGGGGVKGGVGTGSGGGGGGGAGANGANGVSNVGGAGGGPNGGAAGTSPAQPYGGGGGGTGGATGGNGAAATFGGGGGGGSANDAAGPGLGGRSIWGGGGGGSGGGATALNAAEAGAAGGGSGGSQNGVAGNGGTGGAVNSGAGNAGINSADATSSGTAGAGGGGGGSNGAAAAVGGVGGNGGNPGGGGGGGGGAVTGGAGGQGGRSEVRIISLSGGGAGGADLGEYYATNDPLMQSADIVSSDPDLASGVLRTAVPYDARLMGIISTKPDMVMGDGMATGGVQSVVLGLAGRVPVKVTAMNGVIKPGDYITSSTLPGIGMKATKAGYVVGQALTGWDPATDDPAVSPDRMGVVIVFIATGYFNGSGLADLGAVPGIAVETETPEKQMTFGGRVLGKFMDAQHDPSAADAGAVSASEILADRVAAAVEVITPQVTTHALSVDTINASTGNDVEIALEEGGTMIFTSLKPPDDSGGEDTGPPDGETRQSVITFDYLGNATFAGDVTAKSITADSIIGLEVFTNRIALLSDEVSDLASDDAPEVTPEDIVDVRDLIALVSSHAAEIGAASLSGDETLLARIDHQAAEQLTINSAVAAGLTALETRISAVEATLAVDQAALTDITARLAAVEAHPALELGALNITGNLSVSGLSTFTGGMKVDVIGSMGSILTFLNDTKFIGRPYFNRDTGGFALIRAGEREARVAFSEPYLEQPVVQASITLDALSAVPGESDADRVIREAAEQIAEDAFLDAHINYAVTRKSVNGFTIRLSAPAPSDIRFSWIALAVTDARTEGGDIPVLVPPASETVEPEEASVGVPQEAPAAQSSGGETQPATVEDPAVTTEPPPLAVEEPAPAAETDSTPVPAEASGTLPPEEVIVTEIPPVVDSAE